MVLGWFIARSLYDVTIWQGMGWEFGRIKNVFTDREGLYWKKYLPTFGYWYGNGNGNGTRNGTG